ncbi:MAG: helix-turn-helix domain-containing protein [Steroidobacteraceae bacterium]
MNTQAQPRDIAHDNAWDQVVAIVGQAFLDRLSPSLRSEFEQTISKASTMGRDARGPVREIQTLLGDRWSTLLLHLLHYGALRFSVLQRIISTIDDVGISRRMLSFSLRALERDGLVSRKVIASVPPNVEYALTPLGQELWQRVFGLVEWLSTNAEKIIEARAAFEQKED